MIEHMRLLYLNQSDIVYIIQLLRQILYQFLIRIFLNFMLTIDMESDLAKFFGSSKIYGAESVGAFDEQNTKKAVFQNSAVGSELSNEPDYLKLILTAQVYPFAKESPLTEARNLSTRFNNNILFKREDMQPVFSFKLRGAFNRMQQLTREERLSGIIACSAGNHAQGVALAAKEMGIKATIVMPVATPSLKWENVKRMGAEVVLFGNDFDESKTEAARLSKLNNLINISPFDDPYVIAGQGTIGYFLC